MAPGVDGLLGRLGAGHRGDGTLGTDGVLEPMGKPRPMRADFWLQTFVQNPLPVEPLPAEPAAGEFPPAASGNSSSGSPEVRSPDEGQGAGEAAKDPEGAGR